MKAQIGLDTGTLRPCCAKPAVVNGEPRSLVNTNGDLGSCSPSAACAGPAIHRPLLDGWQACPAWPYQLYSITSSTIEYPWRYPDAFAPEHTHEALVQRQPFPPGSDVP